MGKVIVVTDSTAYIPSPLILKHGIRVVPLSLVWGSEVFRDGVDIMPAEFYARLKTAKVMPSTSQTTPDEFKKVFSPIVEAGNSVLAVLLSSKLSGNVISAVQAKQAFPGAKIEIVDTLTTAMALGFITLAAARAIQGGADLAEATQVAKQAIDKCGIIFVVDTLEFMRRGGRIGGAAAFLGTALNMKPLLTLTKARWRRSIKSAPRAKPSTGCWIYRRADRLAPSAAHRHGAGRRGRGSQSAVETGQENDSTRRKPSSARSAR